MTPTNLLEQVKAAHRAFPTGVMIVTLTRDDHPYGLAVNAFSSISLTPPLVSVCVASSAATHSHLFRSDRLAINILAHDQAAVAATFARTGGEKFNDIEWTPGASGAPLIAGRAGHFEAEISNRVPVHTHTIFVARVLAAEILDRRPLIYYGGHLLDGERVLLDERDQTMTDRGAAVRDIWAGMRTAPAQTIRERFTDDYVRHSGDGDHSREDFLAILLALRQAVPDLTFTIESTIAQGDRVAYRWASEGTHQAPYLGVPATERHIRASGITVSRFVGERIAEDWASWNRASLLHSLGIIPLS